MTSRRRPRAATDRRYRAGTGKGGGGAGAGRVLGRPEAAAAWRTAPAAATTRRADRATTRRHRHSLLIHALLLLMMVAVVQLQRRQPGMLLPVVQSFSITSGGGATSAAATALLRRRRRFHPHPQRRRSYDVSQLVPQGGVTGAASWLMPSFVAGGPLRAGQGRRLYSSSSTGGGPDGGDDFAATARSGGGRSNSTATTDVVQGDHVSSHTRMTDGSVTTATTASSTGASDTDAATSAAGPTAMSHDAGSLLAIDPSAVDIVSIDDVAKSTSSLLPAEQQQSSKDSAAATTVQGDAPTSTASSSASASSDAAAFLRQLPFVSMFRNSANYIANHRGTTAVYHIPGTLLELEDPNMFRDLMNDVALTWLLGMKIVLVVGCRHQIERRLGRSMGLGDDDRLYGLRVTDEETLRIVKEEAGYVRFEVERQLARSLRVQGAGAAGTGAGAGGTAALSTSAAAGNNKFGTMAVNGGAASGAGDNAAASSTAASGIGGSGYYDGNVVSGNFYSAQPFGILDGVDYKYTGFVRRVEVEKIRKLHDSRDICLLTTLGVSPSGEVFNVNSESLASTVAGALQASKVIFFTEKEMELRHAISGNKIQSLRLTDARNLLKYAGLTVHPKGFVTIDREQQQRSWDRPAMQVLLKIGYGTRALEQGVKRAHIISPKHGALLQELYTRDGSGTLVSGDLYDGIRRAAVNDVASIYELISPLIKMGTLIDRPKALLEKDIDTYYVYTRDNHIVACGQLKKFEQGFAEIGCLVVNKDYRSRGRGDAMLGYLERLCVLNGCSTVFVLSTQTMEWFVERGFEEVGVEQLPPSRQETYNYARRSKIYLKKIESLRDLDASELWWNR